MKLDRDLRIARRLAWILGLMAAGSAVASAIGHNWISTASGLVSAGVQVVWLWIIYAQQATRDECRQLTRDECRQLQGMGEFNAQLIEGYREDLARLNR